MEAPAEGLVYSLPPEVWVLIFRYLSSSAKVVASHVCPLWHDILRSETLNPKASVSLEYLSTPALLQWAAQEKINLNKKSKFGFLDEVDIAVDLAARMGLLNVLIWLESHSDGFLHHANLGISNMAAENGHLHILEWMLKEDRLAEEHVCYYAAKGGHLSVLQWARANGCPWDELTCAYAADSGHLQVLQWARTNGCPWDERTCAYAVRSGQQQVLQWAWDNGCPLDIFYISRYVDADTYRRVTQK